MPMPSCMEWYKHIYTPVHAHTHTAIHTLSSNWHHRVKYAIHCTQDSNIVHHITASSELTQKSDDKSHCRTPSVNSYCRMPALCAVTVHCCDCFHFPPWKNDEIFPGRKLDEIFLSGNLDESFSVENIELFVDEDFHLTAYVLPPPREATQAVKISLQNNIHHTII